MAMNFRSIRYMIKQGLIGVWRNRMMSFASIGSVTSALLILGLTLMLVLNINNLANEAKHQVDEIQVYLEDDIEEDQIDSIGEAIENTEGVLSHIYQSKEQALETMKEKWGDEGYLLEGIEENPLPNSYIIQLEDIEDAENVVNKLSGLYGIDEIKYLKDVIGQLMAVAKFVRIGGIAILIILVLMSIFIISNTIKITVAARKREINIMKYVGATNGYIRGPFIIEGLMLGLIGSLISVVIVYNGYKYLFNAIKDKMYVVFASYLVPYNLILDDIIIIFVSIGVGVGVIGSVISLKKFLNV